MFSHRFRATSFLLVTVPVTVGLKNFKWMLKENETTKMEEGVSPADNQSFVVYFYD